MGNFQSGGNGGGGFRGGNGGGGYRGGNGGGGRPNFRGGDRGEVTMHKAVCDECHKSCEVPFRPSGDKPVYCSDCFNSKKGDDDRGPRRDFGGDRGPKKEFSDRPTQTSFSKPVSAPVQDDVKNLLKEVNVKLDRLTSAIEKLSQPIITKILPKKIEVKAISKKIAVKKVVSKKK